IVDLRNEGDARQSIEMRVASQKVRTVFQCGGVDNRVGGRELMLAAKLGSRERDRGIERHDKAHLSEGDNLIRFVLTGFAGKPLREFELYDGWHQDVLARGNRGGEGFAGWRCDQPLNPRRRIDEAHQNRSLRSRKFFALAPFASPESSASSGTGTRSTPVPLGMKANSWPAFHLWAVRTA